LEIIERGRLTLATLPIYSPDNLPLEPSYSQFTPQAHFTAVHHTTGVRTPSPPGNRSSTREYDDAVRKRRPGAALSPPPPKKMGGERVQDEKSEVKVGRGLFANLRRLFLRR